MYLKDDLGFVYLDARVGLCYRVLTGLTLSKSQCFLLWVHLERHVCRDSISRLAETK
jgi:hypothetical protein